MSALARCLSAAGLGVSFLVGLHGSALAADASSASSTCAPLGQVERRVVQRAEVGVDALRNFVFVTRRIYALNMMEIAGSLDGWLERAHCSGLIVDEQVVRQNVALALAETER
jgi:hypothetical protein